MLIAAFCTSVWKTKLVNLEWLSSQFEPRKGWNVVNDKFWKCHTSRKLSKLKNSKLTCGKPVNFHASNRIQPLGVTEPQIPLVDANMMSLYIMDHV